MGISTSDSDAVAEFLESAQTQPALLVIDGEPGIGKSTAWLAALKEAESRGFRIMSARAGQAESGLAYAVLADLLDDVEPDVFDDLPDMQRVAIDRALLRGDGSGPVTDERTIAAAFLSIVQRLSHDAPVLLAIDDLQWLDSSSQAAIAFSAPRLKGSVGTLVTVRTDSETDVSATWLRSHRPDNVARYRVKPMSLGGLHRVIATRLGRSLPRPTMVRISELSGGNPFYALELARAMDGQSPSADPILPGSLSDLMRARLDKLSEETLTVLLAAACMGTPTVDLLATVTDQSTARVVDLLEAQETSGIVQITGNRVQFVHPLLARGVYTITRPANRRQMHRILAGVIEQPELRARHLALASTSADPETLDALDAAAAVARTRGAPSTAAELVDLAINLGGDQPARRIKAATYHFRAGNSERADEYLKLIVDDLEPGALRAKALNLLAVIRIYDDSLFEAIDLLKRALSDGDAEPVLMVQTLLLSSFATLYSGLLDDSVDHAETALELTDELAMPALTSQVLAMSVLAKCMRGDGVDEERLQLAVELEDLDADVPMHFRACAVRAITQAWTGNLDAARRNSLEVRQLCLDRGAENDVMAVAAHRTLIEIWRGDFAAAAMVAEEAIEHAENIDTQHVRGVALTSRSVAAAHQGRIDEARADANAAMAISIECGTPSLALRATTLLGFIDVSMANYANALTTLQPLIDAFNFLPGSEIRNLDWLPDAVEAMLGAGQITESEPLIDKLETHGRRLDRPWMLATGARCRGMWWAAKGDIDEAMAAVNDAMAQHDRLPMPFERARTLLLLGQLQRRQRMKNSAAETLGRAMAEFERMGASLWAERAREGRDRTTVGPPRRTILSPTELRIAELAASGMTNRDVAAALFISPKTVESNLSQIYRKLGIRSRAQLAPKLAATASQEPGTS